MGASHATLQSSTDDEESLDMDELDGYQVEQRLYPGSGRMMRTFRLSHKKSSSLVVCKTMYTSQQDSALVEQQKQELLRIKNALKDNKHVAPFLQWHVGEQVSINNNMRPVFLVRPHVYTTLSDRLASRPFLSHTEKCWIVHQLLGALQEMHDANVVHGFLTTENIGLTSWNHVLLLDIASYKPHTALPDDDPFEYIHYFEELNKHSQKPREKRCYLAPERFYTPTSQQEQEQHSPLTKQMDLFSAGCCIMETFLNGERACDLGDVMEYRKRNELPTSMSQKLQKIEFSAIRAACRHMLSLNPSDRLSAREYQDGLQSVSTFEEIYKPLFEQIVSTEITPDARMAVAAMQYQHVLQATVGVSDTQGQSLLKKILGPTAIQQLESASEAEVDEQQEALSSDTITGNRVKEEQDDMLLAETEALLKKLESPSFDDDEVLSSVLGILPSSSNTKSGADDNKSDPSTAISPPTSPEAASSLLIYLQLILSTIRNVQRPSSKLVGLTLLERLAKFSSDESKLQRIVPTAVSLLHDQDVLVRASACQVMTTTLSSIQKFAPSDSNIFPQYIFKRVAHLHSDPSLVVRVVFAQCIASLADTAHLFLDISHAVRLYEAVGNNGASTNTNGGGTDVSTKEQTSLTPAGVFTDDVANLLEDGTKSKEEKSSDIEDADSSASNKDPGHSRKSSMGNASTLTVGRTLISSTYTSELAALQEIVSRWVVHIATDQSDQSSPPKRSLLYDLARLCNFFGRDGVMAFILPQILAFLNDRRDWQLRAALFERLASVCSIIGRAATEHFVLPCLETALVDAQDCVMSQALSCLSLLAEMGLLSRSVLVTPQSVLPTTGIPGKPNRGLFEKYLPLLVYPSSSVRCSAVAFVNASCRSLGFPDSFVFLLPHLRPYLRFEPSTNHLTTKEGLERCLIAPWTRSRLDQELAIVAERSRETQIGTQWTSVDDHLVQVEETKKEVKDVSTQYGQECPILGEKKTDSSGRQGIMNDCMVDYLTMLQRSRGANASSGMERPSSDGPAMIIEGSLKLAQRVRFPDQRAAGTDGVSVPSWYASLRDVADKDPQVSESSAIRSVSSLSQVYGLSVIEDPTSADSRVSKDTVIVGQKDESTPKDATAPLDLDDDTALCSSEAKRLQGASVGEWGSDVRVDPTIADTAVLVTKMKGLDVPPLPPDVGVVRKHPTQSHSPERRVAGDAKAAAEWRPRADTLIASSTFTSGHAAPVSHLAVAPDERYFVSASYDGTLRVWETRQAQDSDGVLVSSATYTGHLDDCEHGRPRINDVATLENSASVVSGASDGSLHVWRVDMVSKTSNAPSVSQNVSQASRDFDRSRVSGCRTVRQMNPEEGEIHFVSQFNTPSSSVVIFATQGMVHSMDLRQSREPFRLKHQPDTGYLTSMALGSDSHWMITGTSRGFVSLWDIRFQQIVKLWQHSSEYPVTRLATSFASLPKKWGDRSVSTSERRPFMFVACGQNECGMFDAMSGATRECFRVVGPRSRAMDSSADRNMRTTMPVLRQVDLSSPRKTLRQGDFSRNMAHTSATGPSINALVGNVGGSEHSYMVTGGDDGFIRYWDFATPSKCFTVSGHQGFHHRPTYERVDYDGQRLILCRQAPPPRHSEVESSRFPRMVERGPFRTENRHSDSISDLKLLSAPERLLVSCSRDSTVKMWR